MSSTDATVALDRIEGRLAELGVPGVALAVIEDGDLVLCEQFGLAAPGRPVDRATRFQVGSVSKSVAATAALALADRGVLDLDADLRVLELPWWPKGAGRQPCTMAHLLSHRAGLDVHGFVGRDLGAPLPTLVEVLDGRGGTPAVTMTEPPGTRVRYSGGGYVLAQLVLETLTAVPFAELVEELVLEPAGMVSSSFAQPPDGDVPVAVGRLGTIDMDPGANCFAELAAAGLWSTAEDLARFALALQRSQSGQPPTILSRPTALRQARSVGIEATSGHDTGLGLFLSGPSGQWFHHGGRNLGFVALMAGATSGARSIAVTANSLDASEMVWEIARGVALERGWPEFHTLRRHVERSTDVPWDG